MAADYDEMNKTLAKRGGNELLFLSSRMYVIITTNCCWHSAVTIQ